MYIYFVCVYIVYIVYFVLCIYILFVVVCLYIYIFVYICILQYVLCIIEVCLIVHICVCECTKIILCFMFFVSLKGPLHDVVDTLLEKLPKEDELTLPDVDYMPGIARTSVLITKTDLDSLVSQSMIAE